MEALNGLKNTKIIFYNNSCFFYWIYINYFFFFRTVYNFYKNSKYVISLVPFENDFLFKKWGIKSMLMNNFITYDYYNVIPSDLSSKIILMIGRADDKMKRFELGIEAMVHIIKEIPESRMKIISDPNEFLNNLLIKLKLEEYAKFIGYISTPEIFFKNASLHIFPSISESFGLALCETKIFGIPNILIGLDYLSMSKGGTIILYEDDPVIIAKESIKILKNKKYRKKLGKQARKSMKKFNNELLLKKWIKIIFSIYNEKLFDKFLKSQKQTISKKNYLNIINKHVKLLRKRIPNLKNIQTKNIENFTFMMYDLEKFSFL
jgi:glycosyltransferase involved in cell wall biosynthesis